MKMTAPLFENPPHDCPLCPRLAAFRAENRRNFPDAFNGPVPAFGSLKARLLVVGLAPGLKGANFTGRPFTADYAGDLLYPTLLEFGFARGVYQRRREDGLTLCDARITNAVRCVPPQNKPTPAEEKTCRPFLVNEIAAMSDLRVIVALGLVAHNAVIRTLGLKANAYKFSHGARHDIGAGRIMMNSYHCSRYNTNTGRLTESMFHDVFRSVRQTLDG
jgi:uracil-DNA glycosylase family 4